MADATSRIKRIEIIGVALLMVGAVLLGTAVVGSASPTAGSTGCRKACSLTINPSDTNFANASPAQVSGTHFDPRASGAVVECNMDPTAPVIAVAGRDGSLGPLPVGCSSPVQTFTKVSKKGTFFVGMQVLTGVLGPPSAGTDSVGNPAASDALNYPCPPTQAQVDVGVSCALVFRDDKKKRQEEAYSDISFTAPFTTTTTTVTTTTNPSCPEEPLAAASGGATMTVTPATCLQGGTPVTVTGTGLNPSDLGSITECNTAVGQPTAWNTVAGQSIPVGCTDPINNLFATSSTGTIDPPANLKGGATTGTVGPPFTPGSDEGTPPAGTPAADLPTDSNAQAEIDAADYPCPPTAAQVADGVTCAIVLGDIAPRGGNADHLTVPITFDEGTPIG